MLGIACSNTPAPPDGGNVEGGTSSCDITKLDQSGTILFAASGEVLALTGYDFPPKQPDDPAFVDGWEVKFKELLVTIDHVKISDNPDTSPGDESLTGKTLAQIDGPWAINLSKDDIKNNLPGKGDPGEQAIPFACISKQSDGSGFKTDGTRYAFGFDIAKASASAKKLNLDAAASADYDKMVMDGCAVLYVGTATFKGDAQFAGCVPNGYDKWPKAVDFKLCFKSPTTYVNCQNPDNMGTAFPNEESQRGIALESGNKTTVAQVTVHTDHPFWDSVLHDSPAHFDQFAARVLNADGGTPTVTLDMTQGVDFTAYKDINGNTLSWRYCIDPPTDVHPKFTGVMAFDPQSVPKGSDPKAGLRDYLDFATYNQSTQGHLNSDGLCFVKRNYDSPQ
jgi:hypothetical protein